MVQKNEHFREVAMYGTVHTNRAGYHSNFLVFPVAQNVPKGQKLRPFRPNPDRASRAAEKKG